MTDNEKFLNEAQMQAKAFEAELESERLHNAYMDLENVVLSHEQEPQIRDQLRTKTLYLWLYLIHLLERFVDPNFNPNDVPEKLIQPPPTTGGIVYPPGADPALIDDPQARFEYQKAIAANRAKAVQYRLQIYLQRLDGQITSRAEAFIRNSYTFAPSDREEVKAAILKSIKNQKRQAGLLRACHEE